MSLAALLAIVAGVVVLAEVHRRTARRDAVERASVLDEVVPLVGDARVVADGTGHPSVTGTLDGRPVTVRLLVDSLTLRKLPVLWLEVTQHRRLPVDAPVTVLLRRQGTEFFSPDGVHDHELTPPPGCPRPVRVSTPDRDRAPALSVLEPASALLHDPRTKELALGRRGLRVVSLVAECEQASYRLGRRAVFGPVRVDAGVVRDLVDVLTGVGDAVDLVAADRSRS